MQAVLSPVNVLLLIGVLILAAVVVTAIVNPVLTVVAAVALSFIWLGIMVLITLKQ